MVGENLNREFFGLLPKLAKKIELAELTLIAFFEDSIAPSSQTIGYLLRTHPHPWLTKPGNKMFDV
jgi:hypothetical protein